jgi:hypothetical protein
MRAGVGISMRALVEMDMYLRRRRAAPADPSTPPEPPELKTGFDTGRCAGKCGRRISANKELCASCAGIEK